MRDNPVLYTLLWGIAIVAIIVFLWLTAGGIIELSWWIMRQVIGGMFK